MSVFDSVDLRVRILGAFLNCSLLDTIMTHMLKISPNFLGLCTKNTTQDLTVFNSSFCQFLAKIKVQYIVKQRG